MVTLPLLKKCEEAVHAHFQARNRGGNDPKDDNRQDYERRIVRPIRLVMVDQGHSSLP
jgi:hypothetical protein